MKFEENIILSNDINNEKFPESSKSKDTSEDKEIDSGMPTNEEIENYEQPGAEEIIEAISEEVPEKDKEEIKQMTNKIPLGLKAELVKTFGEQVKLFKDLGRGLSEKINWDTKKTKAVVCFALYALLNVMGNVVHASESESDSDSDVDFGGELDNDFIKDTLQGRLAELKDDGITASGYNLFMTSSLELAQEMKTRKIEKMRYAFVIDKMFRFAKTNTTVEELQQGLTEISSDYLEYLDDLEKVQNQNNLNNLDDSDVSVEPSPESISSEIVLPEKVELGFDSHFSEVQKMYMQEYYDATIEEIHGAAEKFEWWVAKYGHKENFSKFEKQAKDYIKGLIDRVQHIEDNANNPDFDAKMYSHRVSQDSPKLMAEANLENISHQANLRTAEERTNDAFAEL